MSIPAVVNTMGAVTTVRSSLREARLCRKINAMKRTIRLISTDDYHHHRRIAVIQLEPLSGQINLFV